MSGPHVAANHIVSNSEAVPPLTRIPSASLPGLPADVMADVATRLTVADVGSLMLVSRSVRDSVRNNEPLWAAQYGMRWVRHRT